MNSIQYRKNDMKVMGALLIAALLLVMITSLCACSGGGKSESEKTGGLKIVATIFPEYDWAREILGDKAEDVELTLLLDNGTDLHSYQPSVEDILKIAESDVFIYVGGESDEWVEDVIEKTAGKDTKVINLIEAIGSAAKKEEIVEGMQEEEHEHDEEPEFDEHVWLSLKNTKVIIEKMRDAFSEADPANADAYKKNAEEYIGKLDDLDSRYEDAVSSAKRKTVLFGDRFPFRYMTDDYGIKYYAAFVGCSAETEASFETITFLAEKVDELGLTSVMTIDGSDGKIAETIIENTKAKDQKVITLDSMQTTDLKDIEDGKTYLGAMESNLEILKEALN